MKRLLKDTNVVEVRNILYWHTREARTRMDTHAIYGCLIHSKKRTTCSGLMKAGLNNVVLPTLFKVVNNTEQVDEPELACSQV